MECNHRKRILTGLCADAKRRNLQLIEVPSYVGLAPHLLGSGEYEKVKSAGNRKKKKLHYLLIESAWRAVRFNSEYSARYGRLLGKGFCQQKAISIIAKKMLLSIHAVWLQNREYQVLLPKTK